MKKNSKQKKVPFGERINGKIPFLMFLLMCTNVFVIYRFESTRKPRVVYSVERVLIPSNTVAGVSSKSDISSSKFSLPTNSVSSSLSSSSVSSSSSVPAVVIVCRTPYHYFMLGRNIYVEMFGRYYGRGSLCSYGIIKMIFPDRILLDDGSWILNSKFDVSSSFNSSTNKAHRYVRP